MVATCAMSYSYRAQIELKEELLQGFCITYIKYMIRVFLFAIRLFGEKAARVHQARDVILSSLINFKRQNRSYTS